MVPTGKTAEQFLNGLAIQFKHVGNLHSRKYYFREKYPCKMSKPDQANSNITNICTLISNKNFNYLQVISTLALFIQSNISGLLVGNI